MRLYFGGAEIPGWRKMLSAEGVENVSLSYVGLARRTRFTKPWLIKEQFPGGQSIFLDSGAYTVNKDDGDKYTQGQLRDMANAYMAFVHANLDSLTMVSEFDAVTLGRDWIEAMREDFYDDLPDDVFMPIWHSEWGLPYLDGLAQRYGRVGVPQTALGERNLAPMLNSIVQKYGVKLHGIAMTKPDEMKAVRWDSVASTSWLSPSQYGDTIVWTGNELKRYPKKYKERSRRQHRTLFTSNGFDAEAIANDDSTEVLRLSLWSWRQLEDSVNRRKGEVATTSPENDDSGFAEDGGGQVDTLTGEIRNPVTTALVRKDRDLTTLPVMGLIPQKEKYVDDNGDSAERDTPLLTTRSKSLRMCDSCFLSSKCPAFEEGSNCAYDIPLQIKTKDQQRALYDTLIEMQGQRVLFMKMAEDLEGGYADANLSAEMDRLNRMIKTKHDMEQEGFTIKMEAKGNGNAGVLSRLFGREGAEQASALPQQIPADRMIEASGIVDAEVVDVPRYERG